MTKVTQFPQLLQNPHYSWEVGLGCWLIKLHIFIHANPMWGDSFQNTCYVALEVLNMRHNVLNLLSQRNIDTKLSVKPTVVASGLKSFNQKVYCTTNNFSTAILDNIIPIYNMEGEIQIQCSYKGSYTVSHRMFIQVKVH